MNFIPPFYFHIFSFSFFFFFLFIFFSLISKLITINTEPEVTSNERNKVVDVWNENTGETYKFLIKQTRKKNNSSFINQEKEILSIIMMIDCVKIQKKPIFNLFILVLYLNKNFLFFFSTTRLFLSTRRLLARAFLPNISSSYSFFFVFFVILYTWHITIIIPIYISYILYTSRITLLITYSW